ncbi:hypothetical protein RA20_07630 [Leisingera sp. ANG-Vp]|nr:hypothetical protein RA20_07630 [Leisingera sp. ANG-Vp]
MFLPRQGQAALERGGCSTLDPAAVQMAYVTGILFAKGNDLMKSFRFVLLRRAARLLLHLSLSLWIFSTSAFAESLKLSVYGAPPKFFEFLWRHSASLDTFDRSGDWYSARDADVILLVLGSMEERDLVPSAYRGEFNTAVSTGYSHLYRVRPGYYDGSSSHAVVIVAMGDLDKKLQELWKEKPPSEVEIGPLKSCFIAGLVNKMYAPAEARKSYKQLLADCREWISLD